MPGPRCADSSPTRDLLLAILEAIDLPHPATTGGAQVHDRLLAGRVVLVKTAISNILDEDHGPTWAASRLREMLVDVPVTGYVTTEQADAAIAQGKTWTEAVTLPQPEGQPCGEPTDAGEPG
ncbi:hypothetical protein [Streptomyces sp. PAM3C]|uniref:hypothetical protein n=1 Tax=Streptomyces sp. PAM3C TaxID=2847300 RepID=UPI001C1E3F3D|nr:hypothetical protein [Streptomyces sp. PAM3C]MBU5946779.1 hypothetical protein [Streptomyces sp. PAM3C]